MSKEQDITTLRNIDYSLFDKMLSVNTFVNMHALDAMKFVYEMTYTTYRSQWIQEHQDVLRLGELVASKNMQIESLESTISMLKLKLSDYEEVSGVIKPTGEQVPKESNKDTEGDSSVLPFCKGSKKSPRDSRPYRGN